MFRCNCVVIDVLHMVDFIFGHHVGWTRFGLYVSWNYKKFLHLRIWIQTVRQSYKKSSHRHHLETRKFWVETVLTWDLTLRVFFAGLFFCVFFCGSFLRVFFCGFFFSFFFAFFFGRSFFPSLFLRVFFCGSFFAGILSVSLFLGLFLKLCYWNKRSLGGAQTSHWHCHRNRNYCEVHILFCPKWNQPVIFVMKNFKIL